MVDFRDLAPGMKVKIVDQKGPGDIWNSAGLMDHFLGIHATVHSIRGLNRHPRITLEECHDGDGDYWAWSQSMIECIIDDNISDFEPASVEALNILLKL